MKVVIINDASVARGGATGLSLMQAKLLRERGLDVIFFAADKLENEDLTAAGVRHVNAGASPLMKSHPIKAATRGMYNAAVRDRLADLVSEVDTPQTVYHVHSWSKTLTTSVFAALRPVFNRTFVHAHDFFLACPNGGFMDYQAMKPCDRKPLGFDCLSTNCDKRSYAQKLWRVGRQNVLRRVLPSSSPLAGVFMIHPEMARYLKKAGFCDQQLITLRNPATAFSDTRVHAEANNRFIFVGRVEAEKGVEELVLSAKRTGVALTVVGDGPLRENLAKAYPEVQFTGWKDRSEIQGLIGSARALVMPSRYPEPFGLVVVEAALSGVPIILSETAFLSREVESAGLGYACNTGDPNQFDNILRRMQSATKDTVKNMSERGFGGEDALCTTPDDWVAQQIKHYGAVIT